MGRFGPFEGLILLLMQFSAVAMVFRVNGLRLRAALLPTLASYFAAFVCHIIGFILLPDDASKWITRPVISLIWFSSSTLAIWPFVRSRPGLAWRTGLFCMIAYLLFAFAFDIIKPA
ncbi:MAG: hypothetical protein R3F46_00375 [bacterium]